jgi:uncharacterized protein
MQFFDCNVYFGLPIHSPLAPVPTVSKLVEEMDRAGIEKALVWHIAQHNTSAQAGNRLLADGIADQPRLTGCWTILPNQSGEFPPFPVFFNEMRAAHISALRIFPGAHNWLFNSVSVGDWLEAMTDHHIPLFLSMPRGVEWRDLYAVLHDFPELICVICDHGSWGMDRMFRPLLEKYPNVYIDTALYMLDGGLEALVASYGSRRILYGSGFPESYFGGMMLAIHHAHIPEEAKADIASKNLERILSEVLL